MKLPLAYYGDSVLRKKGRQIPKITDEIRHLVRDMIDTMFAHNGIGIAAPQVHHSLALFITNVGAEKGDTSITERLKVFINPKIISLSKETEDRLEGCISIPGLYGTVKRALVVTVRAMDLEGEEFEGVYTGLEARCILHENDHINGVLYIDRVKGSERKDLEKKLNEMKKLLQ